MHTLIHIKADTRPSYTFRLRKGQKALNLVGSTVVLLFRKSDNTTVVSKTCTIADGPGGVCVMSFAAGDVNLVGYSYGEIKVTFADTGVQHALYRLRWYIRDEYEEPPL